MSNYSLSGHVALVTGSLLFIGEGSNVFGGIQTNMWGATFRAYDKATGSIIWQTELPAGTTGGPMTYLYEDKQFIVVPIGATSPVKVDVRVIACANRDLPTEVAAGRFREDLYYRLNVVPIVVPPLRERPEDIPHLIKHFMNEEAELAGLPERKFAEDAMAVLQSYDWPGNIRQLRNVIDWVLIMAVGGADESVKAEGLPPEFLSQTPTTMRWEEGSEVMRLALRDARELFERQYLKLQISRFGGNISKTAEFVGMERSALHRKLKSLGIKGIN